MSNALYGEDNPRAKLTDREAELMVGAFRDLAYADNAPTKKKIYETLATQFGVAPVTVKQICLGQRRLIVDKREREG